MKMIVCLGFFSMSVALLSGNLSAQTVYVPPPLGSHIGGGYTDSGRSNKNTKVVTNRSRENPDLAKALSMLDSQAGIVLQGYALALSAVSAQTNVPVITLKKQQAATGLAASDLLVANSLAGGSGKKFEQVLAMQKKSGTWTPLARQLGIDLRSIVARARAAESSLRYAAARNERQRDQNARDNLHGNRSLPAGG